MKATTSKLLLFCLFVMAIASCKKAPETPTNMFVNLDTYEAKEITAISAVVEAKAKADCTERGVCWGKKRIPTIDDFHVANGKGKGEYTCILTDLEPDQKYYYRAYARDDQHDRYVYANDEKSFTTKDGIVHLSTGYVTDITATSATCSGNITDDGDCPVTERGICFGLSPNPTLENDNHEAAGSGIGEISVALTDLTPDITYYVRAYATSSLGTTYADDEKSFQTKDGVPVVTTAEASDITATSAKCGGEVVDDGDCPVTERGICWGIHANPKLEDNDYEVLGSGIGDFSVSLDNLMPDVTYYVRAFAINCKGTTYAQDEKSFTTKDGLPSVTMSDVCDTTATSVTCSGNVSDDGGFAVTECGFCWSTSPNPTLDNPNDQHVAVGSGTGEFSTTLTGLIPNTTYYVRAYARNSQGHGYAQDEKSFTTEGLPIVATGVVSNVTVSSATCSGSVTDDGGFAVTERGICWSTSSNPTIRDNHDNNGTGIGNFSLQISGLEASTTYYVRAYATNSIGTNYGDEVIFFTDPDGDWIDLGLPSSLLWATRNVGAENPEDFGDYFAWAETQTKSYFNDENYKYSDQYGRFFTKYVTGSYWGHGFVDNLITLQPMDDAATTNWGNDTRTPTKEEWTELLDNCTQVGITINEVEGLLLTGPNGRCIFLPDAGHYFLNHYYDGPYYLSSTLCCPATGSDHEDFCAWSCSFSYYDGYMTDYYNRSRGASVRAVRSTKHKP